MHLGVRTNYTVIEPMGFCADILLGIYYATIVRQIRLIKGRNQAKCHILLHRYGYGMPECHEPGTLIFDINRRVKWSKNERQKNCGKKETP